MISTVLFDLDGTLLDSEPDFTYILNDMLSVSGRHVSESEMRKTVSSGARAMVSLAYGLPADHSEFPAHLELFLDRYEACIPETRATLFNGIDSLITSIFERGMNWGIVTNKSSRFTLPLLKQFSALGSTDIVVCADHVSEAKPHPEGLLKACQQGNCSVAQAIYIGDHPRDIEAAKNAGMRSVAVSWGYLPENPPVTQWQADAIVDNCDELVDYFDRLQ